MNQKSKNSILAIGIIAASIIPMLAMTGFKNAGGGRIVTPTEKMKMTGTSPLRHATPTLSEPENSGLRLRGLVINAGTPYIGEFTPDNHLTVTNIYSNPDFQADGGAVYADGKFYVQYMTSPSYGVMETSQIIYDADTWEVLEEREGLYLSSSAICMTYDPIDCTIYGYFQNDDDGGQSKWFGFGRMNVATGEVEMYNSVDSDDGFMCIAASPDGYIYGVDLAGQYCRIDKKTGKITVLGHTDVKPKYIQSATVDWETGKFYWAGMTDTGESSLYEIDPHSYMAEKIADFPQNQEFVGLYVVRDALPELTPAPVSETELSFNKAELEGTVSFAVPESTFSGSPLKGNVKAHVAVDGQHYEADATPGSHCSLPVGVRNGGLYMFSMWISDQNSQGEKSTVQKWIGPDYPLAVENVNVSNNNGHITLTWDAPSEIGQHGGYIDVQQLSYIVSRDGAGMMRPVTLEGKTTFEEIIPEGITDKITYRIRPVYADLVGLSASSGQIQVGHPVRTVPFDISASSISDFIVIDGDGDGDTWSASWGYSTCESGTPSDDWLLTPEIALSAGEIYELTFEASAKLGVMNPQTLEVKFGTGDTATDMTGTIGTVEIKGMTLTRLDDYTMSFSIPADGNYRIAFHNISDRGTTSLAQISLVTAGILQGPAAPSDCKVEAAPLGELKATVSFIAPATDSEGNQLDKLSKIEVVRGETVAGTVDNPIPGEKYIVTDNSPSNGDNSYQITAFGENGAKGVKATVKGWIGLDIPNTVTDVEICEKDNELHISWKKPETGIHGGYIDTNDIIYTIFEPTYGSALGQCKGTESMIIPLGELTSQVLVALAICTANEAGTNPEITSTPVIVAGPAYTLPFDEHFKVNAFDHSWNLSGASLGDNEGWCPVEDKGPDGCPGVSSYWGMFPDEEQSLTSYRISLKNADKPALRFYLTGYRIGEESAGGSLTVEISESLDNGFQTLYSKTFDGNIVNWTPVEIPLDNYIGKDVFLRFRATPAEEFFVAIDDISVRNAIDYDASLESINIDKTETEVGDTPATVTVRVQNHGTKDLDAASYRIDFYAGERIFATRDGEPMTASFGQSIYEVPFVAESDDNDPTLISAQIVSEIDMNPSNDKSAEVQVFVDRPMMPEVDDLKASVQDGGVVLEWSQPDQSGLPVRSVVDSFEGYRNWSNNKAGQWTIVDEDMSPGTMTSYFFPGSNGPLGWVIFNPSEMPTGDGSTHADTFPAYSGDFYIAAFTPFGGDCMDWLITPELSGRKQRISFMARAESARAGREMFEVYYSTTGNSIADMKRLDDIVWRTELTGWNEYKFDVPEGTKFFAVKCVSHNRKVMHIDDFSYESAPTPLVVKLIGYNIYRDGKRVNDNVVTSLTYRDIPETDADIRYTVRTVYDRGESSHSNEVTVSGAGIDTIQMDIDSMTETVYDLNGIRVYTLEEGEMYVTNGSTFIYRKK